MHCKTAKKGKPQTRGTREASLLYILVKPEIFYETAMADARIFDIIKTAWDKQRTGEV
ncbi:hypothetical protein FACS1894187_16790 [Synergistales bacterium]|nr:hypothetical protein FACS1894187_16790 [Synergistales bacterium]